MSPLRSVLLLAVLFFAWPAAAQNGTVILLDSSGLFCSTEVDSGETIRIQAYLELVGGTADGMAGTSFSIHGLPPEWLATATANASSFSLGDPFGPSASIIFSTCQLGEDGYVHLYDLEIQAGSHLADFELSVCAPDPPLMDFPGPLISGCGFDEWLPGSGRRFGINVAASYECVTEAACGSVAVESVSWALVKQLYR